MTQAMQAGSIQAIKDLLGKEFPELKFEETDLEEEIPQQEQTETSAAPLGEEVLGKTDTEETSTKTLYNDYMTALPGGVRELVTTDYKGVRGSRLGRGNYTTQSIIPGAKVQTPTISTPTPSAAAPAPAAPAVTYSGPVAGRDAYQYYGDVNYGTINQAGRDLYTTPVEVPTQTAAQETPEASPIGGGFTPAWAKASSQKATTAKKAGAGKVASTTSRGTYVAPSSAAAPATAQRASAAVSQAISQGGGGVKAAARAGGDPGRIGANAAAALVSEGGRSSAKQALKQAEKGKIELTNQARKALEKAADKKKKKK